MKEPIKKILFLLWQLISPLLVYLTVTELVFAAWSFAVGQVREEQALPLTALAAALALIPLSIEYRRVRVRYGSCGRMAFIDRQKKYLRIKSVLWIILSGAGACLFFNSLLKLLPISAEGYRQAGRVLYEPAFIIQLICMGAIIPAAEEMVFRGLGYYRLRQEMTVEKAAVLTACCFALFHGNLIQGVYAALLGLFLAWLYEIYDSLWACLLFHGTANLVSVILTGWLSSRGSAVGTKWVVGTMIAGGILLLTAGNKIRREGKNYEIINHNHTLL